MIITTKERCFFWFLSLLVSSHWVARFFIFIFYFYCIDRNWSRFLFFFKGVILPMWQGQESEHGGCWRMLPPFFLLFSHDGNQSCQKEGERKD